MDRLNLQLYEDMLFQKLKRDIFLVKTFSMFLKFQFFDLIFQILLVFNHLIKNQWLIFLVWKDAYPLLDVIRYHFVFFVSGLYFIHDALSIKSQVAIYQ